ncbi:MAG: helix-turn-helix domain-containing protein [Bdellovibrionia bacterium]
MANKNQTGNGTLVALGQRIFEVRKKKGITLDELSLRMQISKGNLSDIERGKRDPRFQTLKAIAEGLGLKLQALIKDL